MKKAIKQSLLLLSCCMILNFSTTGHTETLGSNKVHVFPPKTEITHRGKIDRQSTATNRKLTQADFTVNTVIASRQTDGSIFTEIFISNIGSEWGHNQNSIPVHLFYNGKKVGSGTIVDNSTNGKYGTDIKTTRTFPHNRKVRLTAKVDPRNIVPETHESNNTCTILLTPDLESASQTCH